MIEKKKITSFQRKIFTFYRNNKRDLPWRKTKDPYKILISEIMLHQTQVDRVVPYYYRWITKWEAVSSLACEKRVSILKEWMGLGYNNRAVYLHNTAKKIVAYFGGDVIAAIKNYPALPGIGPYTSKAVRIFSKNENLAAIDTNIRRILIHEFFLPEKMSDKQLQLIADRCLPEGKSRDWHNALMDYGATYLTAKKTGIKPKTVQSRFFGSDRELRAKILRYMLKDDRNTGMSMVMLKKIFIIDDEKRLLKILNTMVKDSLVLYNKSKYFLLD